MPLDFFHLYKVLARITHMPAFVLPTQASWNMAGVLEKKEGVRWEGEPGPVKINAADRSVEHGVSRVHPGFNRSEPGLIWASDLPSQRRGGNGAKSANADGQKFHTRLKKLGLVSHALWVHVQCIMGRVLVRPEWQLEANANTHTRNVRRHAYCHRATLIHNTIIIIILWLLYADNNDTYVS